MAERRTGLARPAVLVTGASKGIGEACALRLAREGFHVFAGVRNTADGDALVGHAGADLEPIMLDVTVADQVAAAARLIDDATGGRGLQALVNNAGVAVAGPLEFLPLDELRRQFDINVIGQIAVTQACLPLLRRARAAEGADGRAGRIVFMSSISGRSALPFTGAYGASKHAIEAAADALRVELHPAGLSVSLVEPGVVATPIWAAALEAGNRNIERMPAEVMKYYGRAIEGMRRRAGRGPGGLAPEKVAETVLHALTARRPRTRYLVGRDARVRAMLKALLPDRWHDRIVLSRVRRL